MSISSAAPEIGTVGTCGTGIDCLCRANHAILFDLPFVKAEVGQVIGRVWRSGQRFGCYFTQLVAKDSQAERMIYVRHKMRTEVCSKVLSAPEGGSGGGDEKQ
ncbi:hypothetical protein CONLIGDRAFT_648035 [Coniochaeta ligniaria NRRL 30616]|uniref:Helicase C-terminal domain-containing protein n=1 Tax=Coniochaeta ligniaria NRRL 30616 TaxID=1408157 RepID=A0A1J7IB99_9PEZI|nr:hypothetical protein CONLIGDRAFT_648035 [Coniochaeta ligniaria NRRL 30616]